MKLRLFERGLMIFFLLIIKATEESVCKEAIIRQTIITAVRRKVCIYARNKE